MKKPEKPPEVVDATVHEEVEPPQKLVAFLYLLLRNELPAGKVEELAIMANHRVGYQKGRHLGEYAKELAKKLMAE
jgi:hypothetical protein